MYPSFHQFQPFVSAVPVSVQVAGSAGSAEAWLKKSSRFVQRIEAVRSLYDREPLQRVFKVEDFALFGPRPPVQAGRVARGAVVLVA
jgi:hypothetical protein